MSEWSLSTLPSPILELQHALLPLKVLWTKERALTLPSSVVFYLDSHLNPSKSWECIIYPLLSCNQQLKKISYKSHELPMMNYHGDIPQMDVKQSCFLSHWSCQRTTHKGHQDCMFCSQHCIVIKSFHLKQGLHYLWQQFYLHKCILCHVGKVGMIVLTMGLAITFCITSPFVMEFENFAHVFSIVFSMAFVGLITFWSRIATSALFSTYSTIFWALICQVRYSL